MAEYAESKPVEAEQFIAIKLKNEVIASVDDWLLIDRDDRVIVKTAAEYEKDCVSVGKVTLALEEPDEEIPTPVKRKPGRPKTVKPEKNLLILTQDSEEYAVLQSVEYLSRTSPKKLGATLLIGYMKHKNYLFSTTRMKKHDELFDSSWLGSQDQDRFRYNQKRKVGATKRYKRGRLCRKGQVNALH